MKKMEKIMRLLYHEAYKLEAAFKKKFAVITLTINVIKPCHLCAV